MSIIWRPQMSVGNEIIDTEHRYLLCLVNTLELSLHTNAEVETVQQIPARISVDWVNRIFLNWLN